MGVKTARLPNKTTPVIRTTISLRARFMMHLLVVKSYDCIEEEERLDQRDRLSAGQVVIPEDVRKALGLEVGAQFVVMGDGGTVVLKRIAAPAKSELRSMIGKVRSQARRAGMKASDVGGAVRRVRRGR